MTRDAVTVQLPTLDNSKSINTTTITKSAVTQANGVSITDAFKGKLDTLLIVVENTTTGEGSAAAASSMTIKAGNKYPNKVLGDLSVTLGAGKTVAVALEDHARFQNADGTVNLDFASGFTGNIFVLSKKAGWFAG